MAWLVAESWLVRIEPSFPYHNPYRWGPALTAGGGMDYDLPFLDNRFSFRLFQADYRYIHANFGAGSTPPTGGPMGGRANLSGVDLSTGIVTHFGHIIPPPPVTYSCSASPTTVFPGDPITVTGTALNLNPKKTATYNWTSDGGTISGTANTANIDTKTATQAATRSRAMSPRAASLARWRTARRPFTIQAFEPPTISCSASPSYG